jgi:hypothetical protein
MSKTDSESGETERESRDEPTAEALAEVDHVIRGLTPEWDWKQGHTRRARLWDQGDDQ